MQNVDRDIIVIGAGGACIVPRERFHLLVPPLPVQACPGFSSDSTWRRRHILNT